MIGEYTRGGYNAVLVKIENSVFRDDSGITGLDGKPIQIDSSYQPERRLKYSGVVVQLPIGLGNAPISQVSSGFPGYGAIRRFDDDDMDEPHPALYQLGGNYQYKFLSDIEQEVKLGDKIYFKWKTLHNRGNLVAETKGSSKSWIFRVPYDNIICSIRDEKIIMIGSNVLIDPIFESWEEILVPTFYPYKDALGMPIQRPKDQWIQTKTAPTHKNKIGKVAAIGSPLKGEECYLKVGDRISYKPNFRNFTEIEGGKYFVLRQDQILAYDLGMA